METPTQQQDHHDNLGNKNNNSSTSYLCRQSSSRWTPTSDQIRILKELYYTNGIRSPTAEQIQRIAARLRQFGKIEGKNVFYWFQNHKARERQKKRFTPTAPPPPQPSTVPIHQSPFPDHHHHHHHMQPQSHHLPYFYNNQQQNKLYASHQFFPPEGGSSSSQAYINVGCSYGSIAMEKSFRECSISPEKKRVGSGSILNLGSWVGVDSYSFKPEFDQNQEDENDYNHHQIETLPLFPIHGSSTTAGGSHHDIFGIKESTSSEYDNRGYYTGGNWFRSDGRTSLELSLNSYGYYN